MDPDKVRAIHQWQAPKTVSHLRSFLGLVNYYRRFIAGYSRQAAPLTDLLKKDTPWEWSPKCEEAFQTLKRVVTEGSCIELAGLLQTL